MTSPPEGPDAVPEPSKQPSRQAGHGGRGVGGIGGIRTTHAALVLVVLVLLFGLLIERLTVQTIGFGPLAIHFDGKGSTTSATTAAGRGLPALAHSYVGSEQATNGYTVPLYFCGVEQRGNLITGAVVIGDPEGDGDGQFIGSLGPGGSLSLDVQAPHQEPSADAYQGSVRPDGQITGTFQYDEGTGVTGAWTLKPATGSAPSVCSADA